tara:strand:+ start:2050 stop:3294 length:1245 start_codon:yes stop_codon:yes gene_type:complete
MKYFKTIKRCRLCGSYDLKLSLDLGSSALCDEYLKKKKIQKFFPLRLMLCGNCKLSQIDTTINKEYIYKDYIYETKTSLTLDKHFYNYAKIVKKKLRLNYKDLVLDIGSNDGILLKHFKNLKIDILGVEPASKISKISNRNKIPTIDGFFDKGVVKKIISSYKKPKVITINNLFANVDNLDQFTNNLLNLIDDDGSIIIESSYLGKMMDNKVFDWIYHEHLSYFSLAPLQKFFKKKGCILHNIDITNSKGGSIRYYFTKEKKNMKVNPLIKKIMIREKNKKYNSISAFKKYRKIIDIQKDKINQFLSKNKNKKIVGFGASATTTTLLSYFNISKSIRYIIDDNLHKVNTYSPGFHIPVKSISELTKNLPDLVVIFAWRYELLIKKRLKLVLKKIKKRNKIVVITPLPNFKIERI